jgi:hypothetical protein
MYNANLQHQRRWYDRNAKISKSIELFETCPVEFQAIVADGMAKLAEKEFHAHELIKTFRSLGPEKVLAMFKAKNRRRKYDQDPTSHKAITYLGILSEENQLLMANQLIELITCIYDYLSHCKEYFCSPNIDDVNTVKNTYIHHGIPATKDFLNTLRKELQKKQKHPTSPVLEISSEIRTQTSQESFQHESDNLQFRDL